MNRRRWAGAIFAVWALSLAWLVKREVFRPTGARLAEAALAVAPGALFYRLQIGGQQIGFASTTIDTLPGSIRVENDYVLDVAALGKLRRTTARSVASVTRALRLQRVDMVFDGDLGQYSAHAEVVGDSTFAVTIVSRGDSQTTRIPLRGPITLPSLLPLRLAFGGELRSGHSYAARLFDPLLLAGRDVSVRIAAESTLVVSDSADLDSTTMVWVPEHFDTVRAFRIDESAHGIPLTSWIDAQGRLVQAASPVGYAMERAAFEIAYENFRRRDTARVARNSVSPSPGDIIPVTALAAGARPDAPRLHRLRARISGFDLSMWNDRRQRVFGDTLEVTPDSNVEAQATSIRVPSRDTALARWLVPEPLIQSHDPRIAAQTRLIIGREVNTARVAALLAHWVHQHLRPDTATGAPSAVRVLEDRRGDCNESAVLYVALARAAGLPARTVAGLLYLNGRFYYHAWAEIHLRDWVAVDPALDQFPVDAAHIRFVIDGLARQVELVPLLGRLKLEVL